MPEVKEIIKKVRKLEITTRQLVDGLVAGNYHSIFKGQGIEFSEIREYHPGDDIRTIDWKVTARFDRPFIKEFIEERDLRVYFIFDYSASGNFGNLIEKRKKSIEITATLMFSAMRNNDNVGLFIFTDGVEKYIPARKGRRHVLKLISTLVAYSPQSKKTDLNLSLAYISKIIKKRSILFIISDFYSTDFMKSLSILKNRQDIIALRVVDKRENKIPDVGLIQLEDEETGEQLLVDTSDKVFRKNYVEMMHKKELHLKQVFRRNKVDVINILTDEPYALPLKKFFKIRTRRIIR